MKATTEKYQQKLLKQAQNIYYDNPISEATQKAFLATPRHLFVNRFRKVGAKEWCEPNEDNLMEHLAALYADEPIRLFGDDLYKVISTISQPSFVLRMLDILQLESGHKVFELGAGSGWNAALIGHLVGSKGHVCSLEVIPEVAQMAAKTIQKLDIKNVSIIEADGGKGYTKNAPYDRAIFTAGSYDLPHHFFEQMKDNSLLLFVLKNHGGGDNLFLLRKKGEYFQSIESMPCFFVQMTGKFQINSLDPTILERLPEWSALKDKQVTKRQYWWGDKGREYRLLRTNGIRSFLGIVEPSFCAFKTEITKEILKEEYYFGLWDKEKQSLVIAKDEWLTSYGNSVAEERLMQKAKQWVELGMPSAACFDLKIYPIDYPLTASKNQWIVKRSESQFLWSLNI